MICGEAVEQILKVATIQINPYTLSVKSRKVVWPFLEQLCFEFVPVLNRLQGRP